MGPRRAALLLPALLLLGAPARAEDAAAAPPAASAEKKGGHDPTMFIGDKFHQAPEVKVELDAANAKERPKEQGHVLRTQRPSMREIKQQTGGVVELTPDNFNDYFRGSKHAFIKFYAPWCGHCKRLAEPWKKLAIAVNDKPQIRSKVVIAKCDVDKYEDIRKQMGVSSYPTIVWINSNVTKGPTRINYPGERTYEALEKFVMEHARTKIKVNRVFAYDMLAWKFSTATDNAYRKEVVEALKRSLASEATHDAHRASGDVYLRIMEKALKRSEEEGVESVGPAYFEEERERLSRLLQDEVLTDEKVSEFENRRNVAESFARQILDPLS